MASRSCASPTSRATPSRPGSNCATGRVGCRWSCSAGCTSRRSAPSRTSSRYRHAGSCGSCSPHRDAPMTYRHTVRVRYGECDMQRIVFNAHYLAYCDDAVDTWFRTVFSEGFEAAGFDFVVKKASVEWTSPLRFRDVAELACSVSRWGRSSFDVTVEGTVGGEPRFTATLVYVSVRPHTTEPAPVPDAVRAALSA